MDVVRAALMALAIALLVPLQPRPATAALPDDWFNIDLGTGWGLYRYTGDSQVQGFYGLSRSAILAQVYAELYVLRHVGMGFRYLTTIDLQSIRDGFREGVTFGDFTAEHYHEYSASMFTLQLRPWISADGRMRLGLVGGRGNVGYKVTSPNRVYCFPFQYCEPSYGPDPTATTNGTARLGEINFEYLVPARFEHLVDTTVGIRLAAGAIATELEPIDTTILHVETTTPAPRMPLEADASGGYFVASAHLSW